MLVKKVAYALIQLSAYPAAGYQRKRLYARSQGLQTLSQMEKDIPLIVEVITILFIGLTALTISFFFIHKNRELKHSHELLRSQIEIQEQSFDNIYREIHDN